MGRSPSRCATRAEMFLRLLPLLGEASETCMGLGGYMKKFAFMVAIPVGLLSCKEPMGSAGRQRATAAANASSSQSLKRTATPCEALDPYDTFSSGVDIWTGCTLTT